MAVVVGLMMVFVIIAIVTILVENRNIEARAQTRIDKIPTIITVQKYDSITENKLDSISVSRQMQHAVVDHLHDEQLQDVLDSLYNVPRQPH